MDVSQKVALVTGGGRGIGRGAALVLARNGADVAVADLNTPDAAAVAAEVEAVGRRSIGVAVDVTDIRSVEDMVSGVIEAFGRIDILVNNAGIIAAPGWENRVRSNEDDWDQIYEVNVKGIAYPVATYQVVDSHEHLGERRQLIHEDQPNLKLDLDLDAMSVDEVSRAAAVLQQALDRLASATQHNRTEHSLPEDTDPAKLAGAGRR